jgi:outer membrane lipoprotein-sorting protein
MKGVVTFALFLGLMAGSAIQGMAADPDAAAIVKACFNHYRGKASKATIEMVIHRPTWERSMQMQGWTKGTDLSLIHITAPAKDKDNGTLKKGHDMWTYNPKINRIIKLPPSLMSQSWLGSDFSNNDLSKSDAIINDYTHSLTGTETHQGHRVYVIKSMPKPEAPVVWGMQIIKVRDDHVMLYQEFFDEELQPVKRMTTDGIQMMGGRMFPKIWKMQEVGTHDQYTLLRYHQLSFLDDLPDQLFTTNQLKVRQRR